MRRGLDLDVLACPCGGRFAFVAAIVDPRVARRIVAHLGLCPDPPPARAPPPPSPTKPPSAFSRRLAEWAARHPPPESST